MTRGYYGRNKNIKISKFVFFKTKPYVRYINLHNIIQLQSVFLEMGLSECRDWIF